MRLLKVRDLEDREINVGYLLKIADNLIKRRYAKEQQQHRYVTDRRRHHAPTENVEPSELAARWSSDEVQAALGRLKDHERDAIYLTVCQGISYEDAARCLGVPATTLNNWKFRGLRKLRDDLDRSGADAPGRGRGTAARGGRTESGERPRPDARADRSSHRHGRRGSDAIDRPDLERSARPSLRGRELSTLAAG